MAEKIKVPKAFLKRILPTKKYLDDKGFPLLLFGFIRMKVDTNLFLPGCYYVVHYSILRKLCQNNLAS